MMQTSSDQGQGNHKQRCHHSPHNKSDMILHYCTQEMMQTSPDQGQGHHRHRCHHSPH